MNDPARHALDPLLRPRSIALVGASERPESYSARILRGLVNAGFDGDIHLVSPRQPSIGGLPSHADIASIPVTPDHAVLVVRNERVEQALRAVADRGIPAVTLYGTCTLNDRQSTSLKDRLQGIAREAGIAVCGGNGMGFYNRESRVCLQLGQIHDREAEGNTAFIAHSGSVLTAFCRDQARLPLNLSVSAGQELTTTAADYMDFALSMPSTRVICLFLETVRDPAAFVAALERAAEQAVPVVVCKVGRSEVARAFAVTHTGALSGDDKVFDAVCNRYGAIRVPDLDDMLTTAQLCTMRRAAGGGGPVALLESGGERELLVDIAEEQAITFPALSPPTRQRLADLLEDGFDAVNPLDAWGAGKDVDGHFRACLEALLEDESAAIGVWVADLHDDFWLSARYAQIAREVLDRTSKPLVFVSSVSQSRDEKLTAELASAGIPVLKGMRAAMGGLAGYLQYQRFRARAAPAAPPDVNARTVAVAEAWAERLLTGARPSEREALSLLADIGLQTPRLQLATSAEQTVDAAQAIGYPVVMKTAREDIAHKSDVGGVVLGLCNRDEVEQAYASLAQRLGPSVLVAETAPAGTEIVMGAFRDPQFGPLVMVGAGGILVEVLDDAVFAVPPFDTAEARRLVDRLRVRPLLDGVRGQPPASLDALCEALSLFSRLVTLLGEAIEAFDVNPLIVSEHGAVAADALLVGRMRENP